jgi:hypothetical protein
LPVVLEIRKTCSLDTDLEIEEAMDDLDEEETHR